MNNNNEIGEHGIYLPKRYLLVLWILLLSAVAFLDRTNISIAGVQISWEFGIDNNHLGWVFSAFLVGYAIFQIPGGMLARKFGSRLLLALSVIWWGVFTVLITFVSPGLRGTLPVLIFILVRFSLGAGEALMYPAASQFVERWFPILERGKANGIIFAGVGLGSGLTPPLVTAITLHYGWRSSFWFSAFVGIVAGTIWYLIARDSPEKHPLVNDRELAWIVNGRGDDTNEAHENSVAVNNSQSDGQRIPWLQIFSSRTVLALSISYFTFGYIAWIFFSWFYIYLAQVRGLNLKTSATYSMFPFIAMTLGSFLGGIVSDWLAAHMSARAGRCFLPASALAFTAVLLVMGSHAHSAQIASIVLACGAGALYISQSCYWSVATDISGEYASVVSGAMNMGCQIGGAVTASLTPLIASHFGWNMSFMVATLLATLGAFAWLMVNPMMKLQVMNEVHFLHS